MKPRPMPSAIEKDSGIANAATTAGALSVMSCQSRSARLRAIRQATNNNADAVA